MHVIIQKGVVERPLDIIDVAMASPNHVYRQEDGAWVYAYRTSVPDEIPDDLDDYNFAGLRVVRTEPLKSVEFTFRDEFGNGFEIAGMYTMPPYSYADGPRPVPEYFADNRYHRSWEANGTVTVGDQTFEVLAAPGDSDHSWGTRDSGMMAWVHDRMWAFQKSDGSASVHVLEQGDGYFLGYVNLDGKVSGVDVVEYSCDYSETGLFSNEKLKVTDVEGRTVSAYLDRMYAVQANGGRMCGFEVGWGYQGVGTYQVDGWGECEGISVEAFSAGTTPEELYAGTYLRTPWDPQAYSRDPAAYRRDVEENQKTGYLKTTTEDGYVQISSK
ncbi:hypothetical protein DM793_03020 [Paenarthrobacter nitroguajacolicus]|nr:hypothetical protein [Paenarthrobacter nitroguajacolicus]